MEWWSVVVLVSVILILGMQAVILWLMWALVSGSAQTIERQKQLNDSMQQLSDQLADMEEQFVETKTDIRKVSQHFVNFAKGIRQVGLGKRWEDGF